MHDKFKNSNKKGSYSENLFYENLVSQFPNATISKVTDEAHQGDFRLKTNELDVLIELKAHDNNVQKIEIERFTKN